MKSNYFVLKIETTPLRENPSTRYPPRAPGFIAHLAVENTYQVPGTRYIHHVAGTDRRRSTADGGTSDLRKKIYMWIALSNITELYYKDKSLRTTRRSRSSSVELS